MQVVWDPQHEFLKNVQGLCPAKMHKSVKTKDNVATFCMCFKKYEGQRVNNKLFSSKYTHSH